LIPLYYLLPSDTAFAAWKPVFWLESLALWAFGFSWLIKGETLWQDSEARLMGPFGSVDAGFAPAGRSRNSL
jgi:hypothetical protein